MQALNAYIWLTETTNELKVLRKSIFQRLSTCKLFQSLHNYIIICPLDGQCQIMCKGLLSIYNKFLMQMGKKYFKNVVSSSTKDLKKRFKGYERPILISTVSMVLHSLSGKGSIF